MSAVESYDASRLLRFADPESLFCVGVTPTEDAITSEYRRLARIWHSDFNKSDVAPRVFDHVTKLKDQALLKVRRGDWSIPGIFDVPTIDGKRLRAEYRRKCRFELGEMYVGDRSVIFAVEKQWGDLFTNARRRIGAFKFQSPAIEKDIARYLPSIQQVAETRDAHLVVVRKTPDLLLLSDVVEHFGGRLDSKHSAWIVSSLLNLNCYFQVSQLTHNALNLDTCFISPRHHSVALLGGWWYAAMRRERMAALPERTMRIAPPDVLRSKLASRRCDLELVRSVARELLGDASGVAFDSKLPQPLRDWVRLPSCGDAIKDYDEWKNLVLPASFGPPKFVELKLTADDLYTVN